MYAALSATLKRKTEIIGLRSKSAMREIEREKEKRKKKKERYMEKKFV